MGLGSSGLRGTLASSGQGPSRILLRGNIARWEDVARLWTPGKQWCLSEHRARGPRWTISGWRLVAVPLCPAFLVCEQRHRLHVAEVALPTSLREWPGSPGVSEAEPGAKGLKSPPSPSVETAYSPRIRSSHGEHTVRTEMAHRA